MSEKGDCVLARGYLKLPIVPPQSTTYLLSSLQSLYHKPLRTLRLFIMKLAIVVGMLFVSLPAAAQDGRITYFCLKGGDSNPSVNWSCSDASNRACKQSFVFAFFGYLLTDDNLL
jgi:hypothetical protein